MILKVTGLVLSAFNTNEQVSLFLRGETTVGQWFPISKSIYSLEFTLYSGTVRNQVYPLLQRGHTSLQSIFLGEEGKQWTENIWNQLEASRKSTCSPFLSVINQLPGQSIHVSGFHYDL